MARLGTVRILTQENHSDNGCLERTPSADAKDHARLLHEAGRTERTHHEAHVIRPGIGRAVYAYRLASGTLPKSLETLAEKGFMPARYLRDENDLPLKSWREGDTIIVESPGKDHWRHSWQGLDARR